MKFKRRHVIVATTGILVIGALTPVALASPGAGVTAKTFVTANLDHEVRANSDGVKFRTKGNTEVRVQTLVLAAGAHTGWHHHPGMVIVAVESGAVTVMNSQCMTTTYGPGLADGAAFTESGDEPLQVTSAGGATVVATYVVPHAEPAVFRVEAEAPDCS